MAAARRGSAWIDPNACIAHSSGYLDFKRPEDPGPPDCFPVILELCEGAGPPALRARGIDVPLAYPQSTRYCTARLSRAQFNRLRKGGFGRQIARWELQLPVIPLRPQPRDSSAFGSTSVGKFEARAQRPVTAGRWLLGVIDTGCPFAHAALDGADGATRLLKLWDQDEVPALRPLHPHGEPAGFRFGWEVFRDTLREWIDAHRDAGGRIDEDSCYLGADYGMVAEFFGHGAAVLSLLAAPMRLDARYPVDGGDRDHPPTWKPAGDIASQADIVFVQAPRDAVQDSSSAAMPRSLLDGLRYIVASKGNETERIVVNISDGTSRNLHDGSSIFECAMAELVAEVAADSSGRPCTLQIVIAAGNSFDERRHARVRPQVRRAAGARAAQVTPAAPTPACRVRDLGCAVVLRIPPDCENAQFLNIRVPQSVSGARFRLTPPGGSRADAVELHAGRGEACWPASSRRPSCWLAMQPPQPQGGAYALIAWAPTSLLSTVQRARGVAGDWCVECFCSDLGPDEDSDVHFWISLSQANDGAIAPARQARFVDFDGRYDPARYLREAQDDAGPLCSVIQRHGSLSGFATTRAAPGISVVGSRYLRVVEGSPWEADYSSSGPSPARANVDGWRPTEFTRGVDGIRVGGTRSGQSLRVTGTSFAPAQWIRELLQQPPGAPGPEPGGSAWPARREPKP